MKRRRENDINHPNRKSDSSSFLEMRLQAKRQREAWRKEQQQQRDGGGEWLVEMDRELKALERQQKEQQDQSKSHQDVCVCVCVCRVLKACY